MEFWKRYGKWIVGLSVIFILLTLGNSSRTPFSIGYLIGVVVGTFGIVSFLTYILYLIRKK